MRSLALLPLLLTVASPASAAPLPPPDPSHGERYDGRVVGKPGWGHDLLVVPRLFFAVPRLVIKTALWPIQKVLEFGEEHSLDVRALDLVTSEDGKRGIRPDVGILLSFRPTVGVSLFDTSTLGPGRRYDILFASGGPNVIELQTHVVLAPPEHTPQLELHLVHRRRDDQLFTGLDGNGPAARYGIRLLDLWGLMGIHPLGPVRVFATTGLGLRSFFDGALYAGDLPVVDVYCQRDAQGACIPGTVDESKAPGFARGTEFLRTGMTVHLDTRDSPYRPTRGLMVDLHGEVSGGLRAGEATYARFVATVGGAVPLGDHGQTLVLQVRGDQMNQLGGPPIPFSERITLGGPNDLRGARPGEFRGVAAVLGTVEYRWPIWLWADGTLFADLGQIGGSSIGDFDLAHLHPDVGFGVRVVSRRSFVVRLQMAYGWGDGWQTFVSATPGI